jgi:predicted transcriptional regulator
MAVGFSRKNSEPRIDRVFEVLKKLGKADVDTVAAKAQILKKQAVDCCQRLERAGKVTRVTEKQKPTVYNDVGTQIYEYNKESQDGES